MKIIESEFKKRKTPAKLRVLEKEGKILDLVIKTVAVTIVEDDNPNLVIKKNRLMRWGYFRVSSPRRPSNGLR